MVITFFRSTKLFILFALVGLLIVGLNYDFYYKNVVVANEKEGGTERLELWRMNLQHVANHPFFGMGPAGYAVYNMTYHPEDARSTHNNYFDILAQTGIIGFGIFLWVFATLIRLGRETCQALAGHRNFEEAYANATFAGCLAAMVAMMLGDWVIPFAYNGTIAAFDHAAYTWIFLGGLVTLHHIVMTSKNKEHT
jgi:O-antigen ligase